MWAEVKKAIKAKEVEPEILEILNSVSKDNEEEKKLKKKIKDQGDALHLEAKKTIESLNDEQAMILLRDKWIVPLTVGLKGLPENIIKDLSSKVESLAEKYEITFSGVEKEIQKTEKELSGMIDLLTGNAFDMQGLAELKNMLGGI